MVHDEDQAEAKAITFELKADGDEGEFTAVFATLDVIDAHEDVTRPGAFKAGAEVLIGAYQHNTGALPVGKGVIHSDASRAWVEGRFNLNTTQGRDTYEAVKDAGPLMEWSYLYRPAKWSRGEFEGRNVRFLEEIDVWSVDPVLKGAGVGTGTVAIKFGMTFTEHTEAALIAVTGAVERAKSLIDLRAKKGKAATASSREAIESLLIGLEEAKATLSELIAEPTNEELIDIAAERLRFEAIKARALGVGTEKD